HYPRRQESKCISMKRTVRLGPLVFALIGAASGISVGMLFFHVPGEDRVYIEVGLSAMLAGACIGVAIGQAVSQVCSRKPKLVPFAGSTSFVLLCAALAAPLGWIAGGIVSHTRVWFTEMEGRFPEPQVLGMAAGAALGGFVGITLGGIQ